MSLMDFEIHVVKTGLTYVGQFVKHLIFRHFRLVLLDQSQSMAKRLGSSEEEKGL